jgi:PilZ domain-containing protein
MSGPEREHPRYAHEAAVTLHAAGVARHGHSNNVSRGGLCVNLPESVPVGIDVEVDIQLVFDADAQSEPLRLPARVVWCTVVDDAHQVGLAFRRLDAERAEYLTLFLRYLDDGADAPVKKRAATVDERFG